MNATDKYSDEVLERADEISRAAADAPMDRKSIPAHILRSSALIEIDKALRIALASGNALALIEDLALTFEALKCISDYTVEVMKEFV